VPVDFRLGVRGRDEPGGALDVDIEPAGHEQFADPATVLCALLEEIDAIAGE
jgi:hypothetical protein